ncbi:hypothetical protein [Euzebya sp.]|uniref:hypothetical protein n=1 Tax=Euzebya sp. TaxID=1971409 RepID=UPI003519B011
MATTVLLSAGDCWPLVLAGRLAAREDVTAVLLDRAADLARPSHPSHGRVTAAIDAGATVLVDTAALRRRGLPTTAIADGISPTDLAAVGDLLVDATDKTIWL